MTRSFRRVVAILAGAAVAATVLLLTTTSADAATQRLTVKALKSAWVPSLCGQHAGHLVDGKLPGIPVSQGEVRLRSAKVAFGRFRANGPREAAAAFTCNQGGVSWPEYVVFYKPGAHGPVYDGKISVDRIHRFENGRIRSLRIARHRAIATWWTGQADECAACGTVDARAALRPGSGTKVGVLARDIYTGRTFAKRFVAKVNAGRMAWARKHARNGTAGSVRHWVKWAGPVKVGKCVTSPDYGAARRCVLTDSAGRKAWLSVRHLGSWRQWVAVDEQGTD